VSAAHAQRLKDWDDELQRSGVLDDNGILRDGCSFRMPFYLRDSVSAPAASAEFLRAAVVVAGQEFPLQGLTDAQIRRTAVNLRLGDGAAMRMDDEVHGQFAALAHGRVDRQNAFDEYVTGLNDAWRGPAKEVAPLDSAEQAHAAYCDHLSNAWKGGRK